MFRLLLVNFLLACGTVLSAGASIEVVTSNCPEQICGSGVSVYVDGALDGTEAERLEALVNDDKVRPYSTIYFNSPGGSLFGGMELARVIRKHRFNTSVAKYDFADGKTTGGAICMSSCTLAYLGGVFRYFNNNNLFGVHRFYSSEPSKNDGEIAQMASAEIIKFLNEMDISADFFIEMTKASSQSIKLLNLGQMLDLDIANNGIGHTKWTVTATNPTAGKSLLYLKGERKTSFGINKMMFLCSPNGSEMVLHVIFDPQGRTEEAQAMRAISLELDGKTYPFHEHQIGESEIVNGWLNAFFVVPTEYWNAIKKSSQIGMLFQFAYDAPVFLGISGMNLAGTSNLLLGIENSCPSFSTGKLKQSYQRYTNTDFFGLDLMQVGVKGVSLERCEEICSKDQKCKAYSYVQAKQWCFPKHGVGRSISKPGIISGHK